MAGLIDCWHPLMGMTGKWWHPHLSFQPSFPTSDVKLCPNCMRLQYVGGEVVAEAAASV